MPGDVIAYTGTSGVKNGICSEDVFINAAHLHVQLVIVGALKDFYNSENGKITSSRCNSYNPFRHNDRWSE